MSAVKEETIRKQCSNWLAVDILARRGLLTKEEEASLKQRARTEEDLQYGIVYGRVPRDTLGMDWQPFRSRDLGYGVEEGYVVLPALGDPDWTGKRPYRCAFPNDDQVVYLFDDELVGELVT